MTAISTAIDIDAPADTVWQVLTDFEQYPEWNPRMRIDGEAIEGATLRVAPGPEAERMPTFHPQVRRSDGRELRWLGHLLVRGLFDGEHRFLVEERDDDRSWLVQSEQFSGLLAGLIHRLTGEQTEAGFVAMNEALKRRAESLADPAGVEAESTEA